MWITLLLIVCSINFKLGLAITEGGVINQRYVVRKSGSPYTVTKHLFVGKYGNLTIEPGTEIRFGPGVMLAVNGTLFAKGTEKDRIVLTKARGSLRTQPEWPQKARLVDERNIHFGRLQLFHEGKWRGVCSSHLNWTAEDVDVSCREMGYAKGNFSGFLSYATNDSYFMLLRQPNCTGREQSILDCSGKKTVQIGSNACLNQLTVHLHCEGIREDLAQDHWWGLEFYNSSNTYGGEGWGTTPWNESTSVLEYVDINYAGVDDTRNLAAAVRASPHVPFLKQVRISHSAYDATNFTFVESSTVVHGTEFTNNGGHGLVVESIIGTIDIRDSKMVNNRGAGVRAKMYDKIWPVWNLDETFCLAPIIDNVQSFPQIITGVPVSGTTSCSREYRTRTNERLAITVLEFEKEYDDRVKGSLILNDAIFYGKKRLAFWTINNNTMPATYVTPNEYVNIKFNWEYPRDFRCRELKYCIKFVLLIESFNEMELASKEMFINNSLIADNLQQGMLIENMRNYVFVNATNVTHNGYSAGIRVLGGAGTINVNKSIVTYNQDNGVNITYDGGKRFFNMSTFSHNSGNGVNVTLNETAIMNRTRHSNIQDTLVRESKFELNEGYGVRVSNSCFTGKVYIVDSHFYKNRLDGINLESCFRKIDSKNSTNFTIGYSTFNANLGHAIRITPILNAHGLISNSTFINHDRHVILIDNTDDFVLQRDYSNLEVDYEISTNVFKHNSGFYVMNLRLNEGSNVQRLVAKYNTLRFNEITGGFPSLNARTRLHAVAIISSTNINFTRNYMFNQKSSFEVATQLSDKSKVINCPILFWETTDYEKIVSRIFDQFSRFDLAFIEYWPVLVSENLYSPWQFTTKDKQRIELTFERGDVIGGLLGSADDPRRKVFTAIRGRTYKVDRDINVLENGKMILEPGSKLLFPNSIGIHVGGVLEIKGRKDEPVHLGFLNISNFYFNHTNVRLSDGFSGRVEILPENETEWGTICMEGWTKTDASIVCNMMGLVIHPDDYLMEPNPGSGKIWRSYVKCTDLDTDITTCKADQQHSCTHKKDVAVRCHLPTWAGMRILTQARVNRFDHIEISNAGLLDPTSAEYVAALRLDYNQYLIKYLTIRNSMHNGIEIFHASPAADKIPKGTIDNAHIHSNLKSGISTRYSFLEVKNSRIENNGYAGIEYNPALSGVEGRSIKSGINDIKYIEDLSNGLQVEGETQVFLTTREQALPKSEIFRVDLSSTDSNFFLVVDLIDWNPQTEQENLTVIDGKIDSDNRRYVIEYDVAEFPFLASQRYITLLYGVTTRKSGRLLIGITSKPHLRWPYPYPWLVVRDSVISNNQFGIITRFYNQESNEFLSTFNRFRFDSISIVNNRIENNKREAILAPSLTKYHELYEPTWEERQRAGLIGEVVYEVTNTTIKGNGGGIRGEHNHVEFANNVWIWKITDTKFLNNKEGGIFLELPKVQMMYHQWIFNHSIQVNHSTFSENKKFELLVGGFYCNSTIFRNKFINNDCSRSCLEVTGTEKDIEVQHNEFTNNIGKNIIEFHMKSHTPYTQWVDGSIMENKLKNNKPLRDLSSAIAIKGVQNITINYNILDNKEMNYELIGGQTSSVLEEFLDCRFNYWGSTEVNKITQRIFDFDDWNNYAIVEYSPFLEKDNINSRLITEKLTRSLAGPRELGGRITSNVLLTKSNSPYTVVKDLTVMNNGFLRIEPGVEIMLQPNVGILILGTLTAMGTKNNPIIMKPVEKHSVFRRKRSIEHMDVRLVGGKTKEEGFVQVYNSTEKQWTLICDPHFNDYTAMVMCRTLGFEDSNVLVTRSRYYDWFVLGYPKMHEQVVEWFWRRTFICDGTEDNLGACRYKLNFHVLTCMENRRYVFAKCGPRKIDKTKHFWGNIRFSSAHLDVGLTTGGDSILEHVKIEGAGILHEERTAAVESVYQTPVIRHVEVKNCAWNGFDFISPKGAFDVERTVVRDVSGYGLGTVVLRGDSDYTNELPSYIPLDESTIPYDVQGIVRMCTVDRLITVDKRVLVYHKYSFENIDCLKIFRAKERKKNLGIRFLQFNMYNDSFYDNAVEIYQSEFFDDYWLLATVNATSSEKAKAKKYQTTGNIDTLSLRVTASAAPGTYGFIAEIVSLPPTVEWSPDLENRERQRIRKSILSYNQRGAFSFSNVGELNPAVVVEHCKMEHNGYKVLNNTSPPVFYGQVQNSKYLTITNNFLGYNYGGLKIKSTVKSKSNAIYANISNNAIVYNTHGSPMTISGHYFQFFSVRNNFIAHNDAEFRNTIEMFNISVNFSNNYVYRNTGGCILNMSIPIQASVQQHYKHNALWENEAIGPFSTTMYAQSAKQSFMNNFFLNRWNIYELVTFNRTNPKINDHPVVQASFNWWGYPQSSFVSGRIWDRKDDNYLIAVNFQPHLTSNQTIVQGKCWPTWRLHNNKCYYYMGGSMTYHEAKEYCKKEKSLLAIAKDGNRKRFLSNYIASLQGKDYTEFFRVWVDSDDFNDRGDCMTLEDEDLESDNCGNLYPFVCERDPYKGQVIDKAVIIISCAAVGAVMLIVIILVVFAVLKKKQRTEEMNERRSFKKSRLRSSQASLHSVSRWDAASIGSMKKVRPKCGPIDKGSAANRMLNITGVTQDETLDHDEYPTKSYIQSTMNDNNPSPTETSFSYYGSDMQSALPGRRENEIRRLQIPQRPVVDLQSMRSADSHPTIDMGFGSREQLAYSRNPNFGAPYRMGDAGYADGDLSGSTQGLDQSRSRYNSRGELDAVGNYDGRETLPIRDTRTQYQKETIM